ncbi:MAG: hypothetical protein RIT27_833 [Pseudomonadota bacterium]|jgi:hypothetical protein
MLSTKVHACGHFINVDYRWTNEGYLSTYIDPETHLPLICCPECGEMLSEEVLHDLAQELAIQQIFGKNFK